MVNRKQRITLKKIFEEPDRPDIPWKDIESLFQALGAELKEGRGSRVRVALNNVKAVFHKPHPKKEASKSCVKSVRRFLENGGITDDGI